MKARIIYTVIAAIALSACGQKPSQPESAAEPPAAAEPSPQPAAAPQAQAAAAPAAAPLPDVPAGAKVAFIKPADDAKLEGPLENGKVSVDVQMGAENIAVKPAGAVEAGSGHHHLLIDAEPVAAGTPVPKDEQHLHFGKGQTEAKIALAPGDHVLQLQFADGMHRSYGPQLSSTIKVHVAATGTVAGAEKPQTNTKTP